MHPEMAVSLKWSDCGTDDETPLSLPVEYDDLVVSPQISWLFVREMNVSIPQRVKMTSPERHRSPEDLPVSRLHADVRRWVSQAGEKRCS